MAKEKKKQEKIEEKKENVVCTDKQCPFHGNLSARGRTFMGVVIRKFHRRICIEFERTIFIRKYERYAKSRTRLHARLPDCLSQSINMGDYVEIKECRQLSKIINFVVIKKIRSKEEKKK